MKNKRMTTWLILGAMISMLLLSACSLLESPSASARTPEEAIAEAVRDHLEEQGAPVDTMEVQIKRIDGDYAWVEIISTDPDSPGGFNAFMKREDSGWTTVIAGSGMEKEHVEAAGIPESVWPDSWLSAEPVSEPPTGVACPEATAGTRLHIDDVLAYCLLYPDSHTVLLLESGNTEIVVGEIMNHIDPRVSIFAEELGDRTLDQYIDEFLAGYEGFEIERTDLMVSGEEAVLLDGIPGQDFYRQVFVAHNDLVYRLSFAPYDPNLDNIAQAEELYALVMDSFRFTP
ncbi:MAG: hypothetical protein PVH18_09885 [Chloroflexota bacterium]|jgi:hypothetical protein